MNSDNSEAKGGMRNYTAPLPELFPPPDSMRPTLVGEKYMVVAGHPLVARIASQVLEAGGNAIDAGVAAGLASNVIQADMCNLGGVAPIVLRTAGSDTVWSIGGVGVWGGNVTVEQYRHRYPNDMPEGAPCSVVPAAMDAWITALRRFGTWSLSAVASEAIRYAENGFVLDRRTALAYELMGKGFGAWPTSREIYWPCGRPPREGDRLRQSDLAGTLTKVVASEIGSDREDALENARAAFYEGDIARKVVDWVQGGGGWMTLEDVRDFRNEVAVAQTCRYRGWDVYTGDIYCQGPVLLQALAILSEFDLSQLEHNGADYLHLVIESLKLAFSDREKYYGDPLFTGHSAEQLLTPEHADGLRRLIRMDSVLPDLTTLQHSIDGPAVGRAKRRDTTNFCIVDQDGNAFSCAPSDTIDGNPIVPGLGFMVSPRGVQSRTIPGHPACLAAGKRPRLTPAPALALRFKENAEPEVMALSACGGDVIPQGILQMFLNVVEAGLSLQQAVEAPRIATLSFPDSFFPHVHDPGRLHVESRIPDVVRQSLAKRGHKVSVWPDYEFDASGTALVSDMKPPVPTGRVLGGAADPRRTLYALGR